MTNESKRWDRRIDWDFTRLLGRFDDGTRTHLMRTAAGAIEVVRDRWRETLGWDEDSDEAAKWRDSCNDILAFLRSVDLCRSREQPLEEVLREFFSIFEHSEHRISQLLFQQAGGNPGPHRSGVDQWLMIAFRSSVYGIVATWFDYKRDTKTVHININMKTGESRQRLEHDPAPGTPRKNRSKGPRKATQ